MIYRNFFFLSDSCKSPFNHVATMNSISTTWSYFVEEKPIVFFDTYPGPAPSFIAASWDRFRRHISTAWTGVPNLDVPPGQLRLFWVTVLFAIDLHSQTSLTHVRLTAKRASGTTS